MTAGLVLYLYGHLSQSPLFLQLGGTRFKAVSLLCNLSQPKTSCKWLVKSQTTTIEEAKAKNVCKC